MDRVYRWPSYLKTWVVNAKQPVHVVRYNIYGFVCLAVGNYTEFIVYLDGPLNIIIYTHARSAPDLKFLLTGMGWHRMLGNKTVII